MGQFAGSGRYLLIETGIEPVDFLFPPLAVGDVTKDKRNTKRLSLVICDLGGGQVDYDCAAVSPLAGRLMPANEASFLYRIIQPLAFNFGYFSSAKDG